MEVVIRFTPRQARWMRERKWHSTARVQGLLDGGCVLRLCVTGVGEVQRWVMQFGADAEVLAPASLRKQVCAELAAALVAYRTSSVSGKSRRQESHSLRDETRA